MKKNILIYNWISFDETEGKGGGVTVYTRNLIHCLVRQKEWRVFFLSSGRAYDRKRRDIFIEQTNNVFGKDCMSFQVVNSPVLSSAHLSFPYPEAMLEDRSMKKLFRQFFLECGGFDVIHFQNLEGLSLSVLELKVEFPDTRFVYSLHNYYLFCPQVMLWKNDRDNCQEPRCGAACLSCMPRDVHRKKVIYNQRIAYDQIKGRRISFIRLKIQWFIEKSSGIFDRHKRTILMPRRRRLERNFQIFRERNVWYANRYLDSILAVSQRVAQIAIHNGIDEKKVSVCYIGTEAARWQSGYSRYPYDGTFFTICYLGYMRREKGFYFFLNALEEMPLELARKIRVKLAVKVTDEKFMERIRGLEERFAEVLYYPGYTHNQLPQILENVQLGIVPPLWEDNLPQVAIEMKAHGIPVLTSDLGGASELTQSQEFVFSAENKTDFIRKLWFFVEHPENLKGYWKGAPKLITMEEHIEELKKIYFNSDKYNHSSLCIGKNIE